MKNQAKGLFKYSIDKVLFSVASDLWSFQKRSSVLSFQKDCCITLDGERDEELKNTSIKVFNCLLF